MIHLGYDRTVRFPRDVYRSSSAGTGANGRARTWLNEWAGLLAGVEVGGDMSCRCVWEGGIGTATIRR
jgi:hypothetical protein